VVVKGKKVKYHIDKSNIKFLFTYIRVMEHFKKHEINKSGCEKKCEQEFYLSNICSMIKQNTNTTCQTSSTPTIRKLIPKRIRKTIIQMANHFSDTKELVELIKISH